MSKTSTSLLSVLYMIKQGVWRVVTRMAGFTGRLGYELGHTSGPFMVSANDELVDVSFFKLYLSGKSEAGISAPRHVVQSAHTYVKVV